MSNDLVVNHSFDVALQDLEKSRHLCRELMKFPHYAKMGEVGIFAVTEKAKQIGMHPLEALNGALYFVNGKVEMQGQAMLAMIRKNGHSVTLDPKSTNNHVIMHGKRADNGDTWTVSFGIEDAKRAGIYKNVWEKYTHTMCVWRCTSMLSRFLFSDILKGCYVVGEVSDAPPLDTPVKYEESSFEVVPEKTISKEQAESLISLLDLCSKDLKERILSYYRDIGIDEMTKLPLSGFDELHRKLMRFSLEYQESLRKDETDEGKE